MGISVQNVCIGVLLVSVYCDGARDLVCSGDTKYRVKNGLASCRKCPTCVGGGIGWNTTAKREEDEHGFRSCYPCVKCPSGTYRQLDSADSKCQPCLLDCVRLNRYGSVRCGGANPGHCGECRIGFKADSKEPNSICTERTTKEPETSTIGQRETILEPRSSVHRNDHLHETGGQTQHANLSVWIPAGSLLLLTMIAISCAVYAALSRKKNKKRCSRNLATEVESNRALINSRSSFGEDNVLEIDGIKEKVRGERPECVTIEELEAIGKQYVKPRIPEEKVVKTFYDRVLGKDDYTLTVAAKGIHGEKRYELFQTYLKLEKSKTAPDEEKWHKEIITFPDYIMEVLKIWLQTADKGATLKALCEALQMASFDEVILKILDLQENQTPTTDAATEETIEITTKTDE